ncbi:hypothetical protein NMY22_g4554 [Coprinellus aureogranulatus]|nr:hypothetical protein NMY22_g4554 [Coprinellus aureogranulatus]
MIDVVFEGLTASAVPAIRDPRTNLPFVALAGARPSLSLTLFWKIIGTDGGAKLDIKTTLIRNITEHGHMFFRWSAFCLRCCHQCFPEDMFPNPSEAKLFTERYLLQARLLLKLLDVDAELSQFILCCDDFLELFLQLWSKEKSIDGPLVSRIVDPTGDYACPIVRRDCGSRELGQRRSELQHGGLDRGRLWGILEVTGGALVVKRALQSKTSRDCVPNAV